jgi:hypothetical protein
LEGRDHDTVHFVVDNVAGCAEVDRVDYFVITIVLVAVKVFGLAAVAWGQLVTLFVHIGIGHIGTGDVTYRNSGRTTSHSVVRP